MNQYKCDDTQCKGYTIVGCRWSKSKQTGNVTQKDKDKYGSDVIAELERILTHNVSGHTIQQFHHQFYDILKNPGYL